MELLTTRELAGYLRLKERTIYDMAAKQQIPCTRISGKLLFPKPYIDRWLETHTDAAALALPPAPAIYAGSSDPLLEWALRESGSGLALRASGSEAGLIALGEGYAALAGTHVLDSASGDYNVPAIRQHCPLPDAVAIRWCRREQGLLVAPGNPKALQGVADLFRQDVRVILRPAGTGSRALVEHLTAQAGGRLADLVVAATEATTENDLAAAIADGDADCGLAVRAAAGIHGLGFVPLGCWEPFDLVMRRRDYFEPPVQNLLALAHSQRCGQRAARLGGYDLAELGRVVFNA